MLLAKKPGSEIRKKARDKGMAFLRDSALERVRDGITTLQEINKVTFIEARAIGYRRYEASIVSRACSSRRIDRQGALIRLRNALRTSSSRSSGSSSASSSLNVDRTRIAPLLASGSHITAHALDPDPHRIGMLGF